ncbi:MAG: hypothetical protein AB7I30_21790, partial [Isosphaeraceae bacterium]
MRHRFTTICHLLIPLIALSLGFHRLIQSPGALLVDFDRPGLDHVGPPGSRGPGNDLTEVVLPRFENWKRSQGAWPSIGIPVWDEAGFGGRPWIGNPQAGSFYPPSWILRAFDGPSAPTWLTLGHLAWAALGTFALSRSLKAGALASAVAATCFSCSPYLIAHTFEGHYPHVWGVSWYPWAFWAYLGVWRGRWGGLVALPPFLALSFLTGHPQEWYLLGLALGTWTVAETFVLARKGLRRTSLWIPLALGLAFGLSVAVVAVDLLPQLAARPWSLRHQRVTLDSVHHYGLRSSNLLQLLSPFALGGPHDYFGRDNHWETLLSFGLIPSLLAFAGLTGPGANRSRWGFGLLALISVVFAAGVRLGLFSLAFLTLPGMTAFRVPARSLFLASLAVAVLAGLGVDAIGRSRTDRVDSPQSIAKVRRLGLTILFLYVFMSLILSLNTLLASASDDVPTTTSTVLRSFRAITENRAAWLTVIAAVVALSAPVEKWIGPRGVAIVLGLVATCELGVLAAQLLVVTPAARVLERPALISALSLAKNDPDGPARIASEPRTLTDLIAARQGVLKTNWNDVFQLQRSADLYSELYPYLDPVLPLPTNHGPMDDEALAFHHGVARRVLDLFSVRMIVTRDGVPLKGLGPRIQRGDEHGSFHVQENPTALPRAFVVPGTIQNFEEGMPDFVFVTRFDLRANVLMDRDPLPPGPRQEFTHARYQPVEDGRVVIEVTTSRPGLLVVGNAWMPGWSARVDGRDEAVLRGNHWQQV